MTWRADIREARHYSAAPNLIAAMSFDTTVTTVTRRHKHVGVSAAAAAATMVGRGRLTLSNPILKAPGTKRLKLKHDKLLSSFAFKFNLRRYTMLAAANAAAAAEAAHAGAHPDTLSRFKSASAAHNPIARFKSAVQSVATVAAAATKMSELSIAAPVDGGGGGGGGGGTGTGRAVQVDPMKPKLKPPGTKRLKPKCDTLPSISAFKFHLHHYTRATSSGRQRTHNPSRSSARRAAAGWE